MNTNTKKTTSPLAAGLTGVVLGVAGVAAVALSDDESRSKAKKKALQMKDDLKKWSSKKVTELHSMQKKGEDIKERLTEKSNEAKTELTKAVNEPSEDK